MNKSLLGLCAAALLTLPLAANATTVRITCTSSGGLTGSYTFNSAVTPSRLADGSDKSANIDSKRGFHHSSAKVTNTGTTRPGGKGTAPTSVGGYSPAAGDKCSRTFMRSGEPVTVSFTMP